MGTRSITKFFDDDVCLVTLYRQYDGYIDGHGYDLARCLTFEGQDIPVRNGIPMGNQTLMFNGMADLACQVIALLKTRDIRHNEPIVRSQMVGNFYIAHNTSGLDEEGFGYAVHLRDDRVVIDVHTGGRKIFSATPEELLKTSMEYDDDDVMVLEKLAVGGGLTQDINF